MRDLPGVGENLQDHLEFYFQVACKEPITLFSPREPWRRDWSACAGCCARTGLARAIISRAAASSAAGRHSLPPTSNITSCRSPSPMTEQSLATEHGFQAHVGPMRSKSRGWVRLSSADPREKPRLFFNYMSHPDDWTEMRACVRLTREIFARRHSIAIAAARSSRAPKSPAMRPSTASSAPRWRAPFTPPAPARWERAMIPWRSSTRDARDRRRRVAHRRCLDHAVDHDRQPQRATIMIGEKASDHILVASRCPASNAPVYVAPIGRRRSVSE